MNAMLVLKSLATSAARKLTILRIPPQLPFLFDLSARLAFGPNRLFERLL